MCQAPVGRVININEGSITIEYNGRTRELRSKLLKEVKNGDYVLFSLDIAIDKVDREEAEIILKGMK